MRPIYRQPPDNLANLYCGGELAIFIPNESSYRCRVCGWIGWPQMEVADDNSGRILAYYPHRRGGELWVNIVRP